MKYLHHMYDIVTCRSRLDSLSLSSQQRRAINTGWIRDRPLWTKYMNNYLFKYRSLVQDQQLCMYISWTIWGIRDSFICIIFNIFECSMLILRKSLSLTNSLARQVPLWNRFFSIYSISASTYIFCICSTCSLLLMSCLSETKEKKQTMIKTALPEVPNCLHCCWCFDRYFRLVFYAHVLINKIVMLLLLTCRFVQDLLRID